MSNVQEFIDKLGTDEHTVDYLSSPPIAIETAKMTDETRIPAGQTCQWVIGTDNMFWSSPVTTKLLPSGMYSLDHHSTLGYLFLKQTLNTDKIFILPDTKNEEVLLHIQDFLDSENNYRLLGQLYRRGILFWGPQGGGKTMTINLIAKAIIEQYNGLVILACNPLLTVNAMKILRTIEPNRLVLIILEEIDDTIRRYGESDLLSMLDGQFNVDKVIYLATTNYPERLPERLFDRPGRFDLIEKIDMPNKEARQFYIRSILNQDLLDDLKLEKYVNDTEGLSIAHIHELIITMHCLKGFNYEANIKRLKSMRKQPKQEHNNGNGTGFVKFNQ